VSMNRRGDLLILTFGAVDHPLDDAFLQSAYRAEVQDVGDGNEKRGLVGA
jgi:hypothetical protein